MHFIVIIIIIKIKFITKLNLFKLQGLHQSNTSYIFYQLSLLGRQVSTSSRSSLVPNLRIQVLHKLAHKIQVGIPVAYIVCEVKLDKIGHWICVHKEDFKVAMVY